VLLRELDDAVFQLLLVASFLNAFIKACVLARCEDGGERDYDGTLPSKETE
jgi:hypothetical protein